MEKVTVKGKVYQIGEPYRSVDDGRIGYLQTAIAGGGFSLKLKPNIEEAGEVILCAGIEGLTVGTITDAPIELEDGEWYMLESKVGISRTGIVKAPYLFSNGGWYESDNMKFQDPLFKASDYVPLYKMVKA